MEFFKPNVPSKCTWTPKSPDTPHSIFRNRMDRKKVLPNILEAIGETPMIRLNKVPQLHGIKCEILAKCEFLNPGGSLKDRIAYRMIKDAEDQGLIKPGYTLIEATSGNTGISVSMAASIKGYKCILVFPNYISNEKQAIIEALGAKVVRSPADADWDGPQGIFAIAEKIHKKIPTSYILNQSVNSANALAHYDTTAEEIWEQTEGKIDYFVAGAGTGGTLTGVARKLRELSPGTKIIGVDIEGSVIANPELNDSKITSWEMEGVGAYYVPTNLDKKLIDSWMKISDRDSFLTARSLIENEGLLIGGSSGAIMYAAINLAKNLPAHKKVVVLLADGIRNYMTKFVSDYWMESHEFMSPPESKENNKRWWNLPVSSIKLVKPDFLPKGASCRETLDILQKTKIHQIPVMDEKNKIQGIITLSNILSNLISGNVKDEEAVETIVMKRFPQINLSATLGKLSRILENEQFAIVLNDLEDKSFMGIASQEDLFHFIKNL